MAILAQISLLLIIAVLTFGIAIQGSSVLFYAFVIAGGVLFLSFGFALGGMAKTQNAIILLGNLFIFPQILVAGVFFPVEVLPPWLQRTAVLLPLNFLSDALWQIANEGAGLSELGVDIAGIAVWTAIGLFLAIRFFRWSEAANA